MSDAGSAPELWLRRSWQGRGSAALRGTLSAAALLYRGALALRGASYAAGLLAARRLPVPVVSVGNLTLGGSGKTPLAALVVQALVELGTHPALLSRGYGRRTRGVRVVADRERVRLGVHEAGDEPLLLAEQLPGIPVVVGESRYEAGRAALDLCGADALVIDDGFQHRTLSKDLEIVAVAGSDPWGNGRLFPRGMLREPLSALRRADLVVVTNPPGSARVGDIVSTLGAVGARARVLTGWYRPHALRRFADGRVEPAGALSGRRVLAVAGVASPKGFVACLEALGATVAGLAEFPDHHPFSEAELSGILSRARQADAEWIVTTEKDWVRLRGLARPDSPLWTLSVRLDMAAHRSALVDALAELLRRRAAGRAPA